LFLQRRLLQKFGKFLRQEKWVRERGWSNNCATDWMST
jgi:hypothetical protein